MPQKQAVLFDHDGGVDDLLSLTMLLAMPHIDLRGVAVTPADCFLRPAVSATQKILRLFGRQEIPVAGGKLHGVNPFPRAWRRAPYSVDALPILNESDAELAAPVAAPAHQFLADALRNAAEPITVLITGPVTNLAAALQAEPALVEKVASVVWMGGALHVRGNVADYEHDGSAEWNAYWDPPATQQLFRSGVPITLFPLDITDHVPVTMDFLKRLAKQRRYPLSDFAGQCWAMTVGVIPSYEYIYHMWDTLSTGYLGAAQLMQTREALCCVVAEGPSAGRIIEVESEDQADARVHVAHELDVDGFLAYILTLFQQ